MTDRSQFEPPILPDDPFAKLRAVIAHLRGEPGCPWDREQTLESLMPFMESECREVSEALAGGDRRHLCEELGDLLFNIIFMSRVAEEAGSFDLDDVIRGIGEKLIRRHPHVFAEPREITVDEARESWTRIKAAEKKLERNG